MTPDTTTTAGTGHSGLARWTNLPVRTRNRIVVAATVLTAVAVALGLGVRWWTHPDLFPDFGGGSFSAAPRPVDRAAISATVIYPKAHGSPETVTIDGADAIFSKNTAHAEASFWICHLELGGDAIGAVRHPRSVCPNIEPLEPGTRLRYAETRASDYLFVTLTPTAAGVARPRRVEVRYHRGADHLSQRGTQSIGLDSKVTAT